MAHAWNWPVYARSIQLPVSPHHFGSATGMRALQGVAARASNFRHGSSMQFINVIWGTKDGQRPRS
jgi:hypothetical protein